MRFLKWGKQYVNERQRSDRKREGRSFESFQRGDKLSKESGARMSCFQGVYREKVFTLGVQEESYREEKEERELERGSTFLKISQ